MMLEVGSRVRWNLAGRRAHCPGGKEAEYRSWYVEHLTAYATDTGVVDMVGRQVVKVRWTDGESFWYSTGHVVGC